MQDPNSNTLPVIPMEDDSIHTEDRPFCFLDPTCLCHENPLFIAQVAQFGEDGLLTPAEATNFVAGEML